VKVFGVLSPAGWRAVIRMALALIAALLFGLIVGRVWLVLALVLGAALAYQLWNLLRVEHWLRRRSVESPPDISGAWGELVAIISRIHRRKQHHKTQVTSLLREFRRLTSAMPEGAVLLGPEHQILWLNPRAAAWLGLRRKRDFGIRIENLVRQPAFVEYLRTGRPESGVVVQDAGDLSRWFSFHLVAGGERQLLIVRDVSREQHIEHMRKDFVANASHELRSPLTVIAGYLDALAEDQKLDPTWNTPVLEMRRQAERMGTIINDLLELSRLESSGRAQEERAVDVGGLLSVLRKEALSMEPVGRVVNLKIESDALLLGVESELHSIASNLVSNAVKYTPAGGEIELRWWTDQDGAYLSVRDTGIGIPPEHIPRLTERFYRVDPGRARSMGGSGLGLSIVKHALQRHDASLQIESREGVGSTFTCTFPVDRIIAREAHAAAV
jgi:two-component system phosphate regulon sensor histidine kinase PhoR